MSHLSSLASGSDRGEGSMKTRYFAFLAITALMVGAVGCDSKKESGEGGPGVEEAVSTATEAYIYGYPLVTRDMTRRKITNVPKTAQLKVMGHMKEMGKNINGWMFFTQTGLYGTQYLDRALVTAIGLGANRPQNAIYPTSEKDAAGKEYAGGDNKYVVHIDKGQFPPVNGFHHKCRNRQKCKISRLNRTLSSTRPEARV